VSWCSPLVSVTGTDTGTGRIGTGKWQNSVVSQETLDRAQAGDEHAFRSLTEPYRRELQLHCYRMLGSLTDAEDVLQETLLAAWRGLPAFEGRASVRTWLYRIATNRCLNARRRVRSEPQPPFTPPPPTARREVTWLEPYPDDLLPPDPSPGPEARYEMREAVELAFVVALQRMPPRQAATLVLRDVLGFTAAEVAAMLGTTETAIKGTLQRARAALDRAATRPTADAPGVDRPSTGGPAAERDVTRRFAEAFTAGDIDRLVGLLTDDAWLSMPPAPHQYQGIPAIAEFLRASWTFRPGRRITLLPAHANTQPAFATYLAAPAASHDDLAGPHCPEPAPAGLIVLTLRGDRIAAITRFHNVELYPRFGLPDKLSASAS
jgi:RNA polymerase sigma-70 factor (ECF subfamily)